jgi:hypothetical protein
MGPMTPGLWGTLPGIASSGSLIGRPARYPPIFSDAFWTMVPDRNEEPIEKSDGLQGIEAHFTG